MAGRKAIPIKAVDPAGKEYFYDSVDDFMKAHEPDPVSDIEAWGKNSKNALRKVARGDFKSYGGWRLSYLIEGGKGNYTTVPGTITSTQVDRYEKPESEVREIQAEEQRQNDYALMMTGANGDTMKLKAILRRQYLEVGVKIAKRRNGEWEPPRGWKASEDLDFLERIAEVNGIDWKHIADTRTEAEMFTDGINRLVSEGATAAMELVDAELEAIHDQMVKAVAGVKSELLAALKDEDAAPDKVRESFKSDGTARPGVTIKGFDGDHGEGILDVGGDIGEEPESQDEPDSGDDADSGESSCAGGRDDDEAGVDGPPGGADRPPAPGSEV